MVAPILISEGARVQANFFDDAMASLSMKISATLDGTSKLIVESIPKDKETKQPPLKTLTPTYDDHVVKDEVLIVCNSEISLNFCKDCRMFLEGEWEMKVNGKVKVDGNELTESDKMVNGVILYSSDDQVLTAESAWNNVGCPLFVHMVNGVVLYSDDDQVLVDERSSFKIPRMVGKPSFDERPRVGQRPRVASKLTRPNRTQIVQYCGQEQLVEGVASCAVGGISPLSWSKYHFGMKSIRRSLQPLWSGLVS